MVKSIDCITYGQGDFDPARFNPIRNSHNKPTGGLWASPIGSEDSWYDYATRHTSKGFDTSFKFHYTGNLLVIDTLADMANFPMYGFDKSSDFEFLWPDFEDCIKLGYDGLHLTSNGLRLSRADFSSTTRFLWGWDCETVLVFNPAGIKLFK